MKRFLLTMSYEKVIVSIIVLAAFSVLFVLLGSVRKKAVGKTKNIKDPKNVIVRKLVAFARTLIVVFALLAVSQINGINLGSVIAGLGLASALIGLALQDLLKDVIMGFHIVSDKFFSVGDVVEYLGKEGVVVGFSLSATKIEILDDKSLITVSNRNISEIVKVNDCSVFDLPLSYDEDAEKIHGILSETALKIKAIDGMKNCSFEGTQNFGESAVIYRFKFYCNPQRKPDLRRKAIFVIQKELAAKNIKIPYNQIDVNIKEEN
ncbi:MAG: mechanosensitive ion channel family protein [Clostridia bacterium]|nr:mechanosensitive ion channel family protein [Clostridia bacterium]